MTAAEKLRALANNAPTHITDDEGDAWKFVDCPVGLPIVAVEEIAALLEIAERGHAIQFKVRYAKLADMLPEVPDG